MSERPTTSQGVAEIMAQRPRSATPPPPRAITQDVYLDEHHDIVEAALAQITTALAEPDVERAKAVIQSARARLDELWDQRRAEAAQRTNA